MNILVFICHSAEPLKRNAGGPGPPVTKQQGNVIMMNMQHRKRRGCKETSNQITAKTAAEKSLANRILLVEVT